jgi:hypothetical protein
MNPRRDLLNQVAARADTLSYSDKQPFVLSVEGAKTGETRRRRLAKVAVTLREQRT